MCYQDEWERKVLLDDIEEKRRQGHLTISNGFGTEQNKNICRQNLDDELNLLKAEHMYKGVEPTICGQPTKIVFHKVRKANGSITVVTKFQCITNENECMLKIEKFDDPCGMNDFVHDTTPLKTMDVEVKKNGVNLFVFDGDI